MVRPGAVAAANAAAEVIGAGADTYTIRLARPASPGVEFARWCSWDFAATRKDRALYAARLNERYPDADFTLTPRDAPAATLRPVYVFSAAAWSPAEVLAYLGLQLLTAD